jgi:hypothetical protein
MRSAWLGVLAFMIAFVLASLFWYNTPIIAILQHHSPKRTTNVVFREHAEYKDLSHTYDHFWDSLFPPNGGYIEAKGDDQSRHDYGISMYHQLHCLQMIRSAIQDLQSQVEGGSTMEHGDTNMAHGHTRGEAPHNHLESHHWLHCFDYLRQVRTRPASKACSSY